MINLVKGQKIDLRKNESGTGSDNNLSKLTIGLGWDINKGSGEYDLDAVAVLLDKNGKCTSTDDVVYYGNLKHKTGKIWSNGDNLTGDGDGDDEQIVVKLDEIPAQYEKIVFLTSIYRGRSRGQHFGKIENAFIRAVDGNGKELTKYNISGSNELNNKCSMVFAECYRYNNTWKFGALGDALDTDSLMECVKSKY